MTGLVLLTAVLAAQAAPPRPGLFLGGQLAVTAEPADGGAEVSLNVLPLVVEGALSERIGLRGTTTLNLMFAGEDTGLAHRGGGLAAPIYLPGKRDTPPYQGFYVAPYVGYTVNPVASGSDITLAGEPGVRWEVAPRWTLNLAGQLGATWLDRPVRSRWVNHFGVFPSFGRWF